MRKQETTHWIEKDRRQLHPVYHPKSHKNPLVIERGEGVWLYTTDGQKILDGMAGLWNVNAGYGNKELAQAAYEQMRQMAFTSNFAGMTNLPSILLADKLAGFAYEGLNTTFFTLGGSEANDSAFKTARYYWKRKGRPAKTKIIARKGAYHGVTMYLRLISKHIDSLEQNPRPVDSKKLKRDAGYSLQVGTYRVLYDINDSAKVVTIYRLKHRKEVYQR